MAEPMRVLLVADEPLDAKADGSKQRSLMATLPAGKAVKASSLLKKFAGHFGVDLAALELRTSRGDALGARDVVERDGGAAQTVLAVVRRADAPPVERGAIFAEADAAHAALTALRPAAVLPQRVVVYAQLVHWPALVVQRRACRENTAGFDLSALDSYVEEDADAATILRPLLLSPLQHPAAHYHQLTTTT